MSRILTLTVLCCSLLVLTGCLRAVPAANDPTPLPSPATMEVTPSAPPPTSTQTPPPMPTATRDPAAPVILLEQAVNGHPLYLVRYLGPVGTCVVATFDLRVLATTRCGQFNGAGVGMVDTLTDPAGGTVRLAYGLALDPAISAVAVEFATGGNANTFVENGAYALVLTGSQSPRRAVAINQYGNLVARWGFE